MTATQKIALGVKQLSADPWSTVQTTYEVGQVRHRPRDASHGIRGVRRVRAGDRRPGARLHVRVDRAFEGVVPHGPVGTTAAFEILSIDLEKKRIGVALVEEGSSRAAGAASPQSEPLPVADAREAEEVREDSERADVVPSVGFGSLADQLRSALKPREK